MELIQSAQEDQKSVLFQLVEDRFARRVQETEQRLVERMDARFLDVQKQFGEVQKQIVGVHEALSRQTRWLLTLVLAAAVIYPLVTKLIDKLLP